jgi:4-deoxy-L-threo-5-hexosulose-uronate ketol-isomerase
VPIDKGMDIWADFGTEFFLQRREAGFFNIGGEGVCEVDGSEYLMKKGDCVYIAKGAGKVSFRSAAKDTPAKFYGVSSPAHQTYETTFIPIVKAAKKNLGEPRLANKRVINQFIHPSVLKTCQLSMGLTVLDEGSVWNTMPLHTHERRMEIYTYFDIPEGGVVFHIMGEPQETRHIVMANEQAVISPSWSVHSGCGTARYSFIWAMAGENQAFEDMDNVKTLDIR